MRNYKSNSEFGKSETFIFIILMQLFFLVDLCQGTIY